MALLAALCAAGCANRDLDAAQAAARRGDWPAVRRHVAQADGASAGASERALLAWLEARACAEQGDFAGAVEAADALGADPPLPPRLQDEYHAQYPLWLARMGEDQRAFAAAGRALARAPLSEPRRLPLHQLRLDLLTRQERWDETVAEAQAQHETLVRLGQEARARRELAAVLRDALEVALDQDRDDRARDLAARLLALDDRPEHRALAGRVHRTRLLLECFSAAAAGDLDALRAAHRELLLWAPAPEERSAVTMSEGRLLLAAGRPAEARALFGAALALPGGGPAGAALVALGRAYEAEDRPAEAEESYRRALDAADAAFPEALAVANAFYRGPGRALPSAPEQRLVLTIAWPEADGWGRYPRGADAPPLRASFRLDGEVFALEVPGPTPAVRSAPVGEEFRVSEFGVARQESGNAPLGTRHSERAPPDGGTTPPPPPAALRVYRGGYGFEAWPGPPAAPEAVGARPLPGAAPLPAPPGATPYFALAGRRARVEPAPEPWRRRREPFAADGRERVREYGELRIVLVLAGTPWPLPEEALRAEAEGYLFAPLRLKVTTPGTGAGVAGVRATLASPGFDGEDFTVAVSDVRGGCYFAPLLRGTPDGMPEPALTVLLARDGLRPQRVVIAPRADREEAERPVAVTMEPYYEVAAPALRVVDARTRAPVEGATVRLRSRHRAFASWVEAACDADGVARFAPQPLSDPAGIEHLAFEYQVRAPGYRPAQADGLPLAAAALPRQVLLVPEALERDCVVLVRDAVTGDALPGARVVASARGEGPPLSRAAVTDAFGRAVLAALPLYDVERRAVRRYRVEVARRGYHDWTQDEVDWEALLERPLEAALRFR